MFELNGTYVIFIASFLVFITLLNEVMLKPVGRVLEERRAKIEADLQSAREARIQSEEVVAHYHKRMGETRGEAGRLVNEALVKAQRVRDEKLKGVQEEGRKRLDKAKAELAAERDSLIEGLVDQELDLIKSINHKLMGETAVVTLEREKVRRALEEAS